MVFYVVHHYSKCLSFPFHQLNNLWFNGLVKTYFMLRIPSRELSISLERESRAPYGNGNGNGEDLVRQSDECECESTDLALPSVAASLTDL